MGIYLVKKNPVAMETDDRISLQPEVLSSRLVTSLNSKSDLPELPKLTL
jgi:hypothetical protein